MLIGQYRPQAFITCSSVVEAASSAPARGQRYNRFSHREGKVDFSLGTGTTANYDNQVRMLDDISVAEQPNSSGYTGRTVLIRDVGHDLNPHSDRAVTHPVAMA